MLRALRTFAKGVSTKPNGDWIEDELATVMGDAKLLGDVVTHWKELGENRKTMVFACNVQHSKKLAAEFQKAGVAAASMAICCRTRLRKSCASTRQAG